MLRRTNHTPLDKAKNQVALLVGLILCSAALFAQDNSAKSIYQDAAAYLAQTGMPHKALALLERHRLDHGLLAANLYAKTGFIERAENALGKWPNDKAASSARLTLAENFYSIGKWTDSVKTLNKIPEFSRVTTQQKKASLLARSLLNLDNYDAAAHVLEALYKQKMASGLDQYNLGIAWLRGADDTRGVSILDTLGRYHGKGVKQQLLADQANLVLGYWFLRQKRGGLARVVFNRIRSRSPMAESAKVGIGWAELAPAGDVQRLGQASAGNCGAPQPYLWGESGTFSGFPSRNCRNYEPGFEDEVLAGADSRPSRQESGRRAAVAWESAAESTSDSPAVQEALVALGFALTLADEQQRAIAAYHQAIARLESIQRTQLAQLAAYNSGSMQIADAARDKMLTTSTVKWTLSDERTINLKEIQRKVDGLKASLSAIERSISGLPKLNIISILTQELAALRTSSNPNGDAFHHPSPEQRGLMIMMLEPDIKVANAHVYSVRLSKLRKRIASLQSQLASAIELSEYQLLLSNINFTQGRLRQSYAGLAQLEKP